MTIGVRTNSLFRQRRHAFPGLLRMPFDQRMDSEASHRSTIAVQENKAVLRSACDQGSQNGHRPPPQRPEPCFCTLPAQPHCAAASVIPVEIGDLHPCRLRSPSRQSCIRRGMPRKSEVIEDLGSGADDYLTKPSTRENWEDDICVKRLEVGPDPPAELKAANVGHSPVGDY